MTDSETADVAVILVAAGRGTRAKTELPKQYMTVCGEMLLTHTLRALLKSDQISKVQPVIHQDDLTLYQKAMRGISDPRVSPPVFGRESRRKSVEAGLESLGKNPPEQVLIHDAARPFIKAHQIAALLARLEEKEGAFLAIPVSDALWDAKGAMTPLNREGIFRAQTPQGFRYDLIKAAYETVEGDLHDDVEIAIAHGLEVEIVLGAEENFKITHPEDFDRAKLQLEAMIDLRTGTAFDVHKFGSGDHVILNGIRVPHSKGLIGHSDADVAMHAITDALFGALAEGDIGQWFPPSEAQWKGASSEIFLAKAVARARDRGFQITHLDCTIICEFPKIGPHAEAMRENLARISGIDASRISVKATTSEGLGFTGRQEGIAAIASASLVAT